MVLLSHKVAPKPTALLSVPLIATPAVLPAVVFVVEENIEHLRMILESALLVK